MSRGPGASGARPMASTVLVTGLINRVGLSLKVRVVLDIVPGRWDLS